jgi:hypothetical protein
MTRRAQLIAGFLTVGLARAAIACDCLPATGYTDKDVQSALAKADAVVHAKVVSLTTDREARIMIYESFKGQPSVLKAQSEDQGGCGTTFRAGEEAIYIVYSGEVGLCGRLPPQSDLVRRLRAHKR